jgi:hypothetical protein
MSLHKFAEQVASQGRGDDSLLVHMTPDEVRNLQRFAQANGTTLTINPTTGLPEAGLLSDLFKAVAPIALGAFLGPAGLGMSSMMAGLTTGGITTLATGSLSRGLMAGLGAYGGSGLGESLMGAGTGAGMTEALAGSATGTGPQVFGDVAAAQGSSGQAFNEFLKSNANPATMSASELASSGLKAAATNPLDFAKQNFGNLAYAAAPIAAGLMVPTTTKLPDPKDTGRIRQMAFNINPDTGRPDPLYGMREMPVVKTSDFGDKTFKGQRDLFYQQNPNPYELGVGSLNQPPQQQTTPMAEGGIVALAGGGDAALAAYQAGNYGEASRLLAEAGMSAQDVVSKYGLSQADAAAVAQNLGYTGNMSGLTYAAAPPAAQVATTATTTAPVTQADTTTTAPVVQAATAAPTYTQYTNEQIGSYLAANPTADITAATKATNADPAAVNAYIASLTSPFVGSTLDTRGSGTLGIYNQLTAQGIDPDEYYKAALANDPKYAGWSLADIKRGYKLDEGAYALSKKLSGNVSDKDWVKFMDEGGYSVNDMAQAFGLSTREVQARYDAAKQKTETKTQLTCPAGYRPNAAGTACELIPVVIPPPDPFVNVTPTGFYGNDTGNPLTRTPGDITRNPDGTVTVQPNIPGRPTGGFPGMESVRNAYTAGGGSLGYTSPVRKDPEAYYNKMTDDSLDAYNYLMGKGKNLTQRKAETKNRPVMQRYDEAVLGRKMPKLGAKTTDKATTVVGVPGNPQSYFNETEYLAANPDVAAELKSGKSNFTSAYEHYLMYGKREGRKFAGDYEGYLTAAALASAAGAGGGGDGPTGPSGNTGNTISGFNPAPPDTSIPESFGLGPASTDGNTGSTTGTVGGSVASANGGLLPRGYAMGGGLGSLGSYSDGGRLLKGPGDGVSDSIPATIGRNRQPARLADGEFVIPARIVSELGNGSTEAGAKKLYAMMDRVQRARGKTTGKNKVAANSRSDKYLPA